MRWRLYIIQQKIDFNMPLNIGQYSNIKSSDINNLGMSIKSIVTEGMITHCDSANNASYDGSGTTWTDLTGNGFNGTLQNGLGRENTYGSFDFNGVNHFVSFNFGSATTSEVTVELWCKRTDTSGAEYFWDARNDGGTWMLCEYNGYDWNWGNGTFYNDNNLYTSWHQYVATSDSSGSRLYRNGLVKATGGSNNARLGNSFHLGTRYTQSSWWLGQMAIFRVYDRVLNENEVQQNFLASKDRFGI
jgi:hypothetical protein